MPIIWGEFFTVVHTNATLFSNSIHDPRSSHPAKPVQANEHSLSVIMKRVKGSSVDLEQQVSALKQLKYSRKIHNQIITGQLSM